MSKLSNQQQSAESLAGPTEKSASEKTSRALGSMAPIDRQLKELIEQAEEIGEDRGRLDSVLRDLGTFRETLGGRVTNLKRVAIHISHEERTLAEQRSLLESRRREVNQRLRELEHREAALETYQNRLGEETQVLRETQAGMGAEAEEIQRQRSQLVADQRSLQRQVAAFESEREGHDARVASLASAQAALAEQEATLGEREAALASSQEGLTEQEARLQSQRAKLDEATEALAERARQVEAQEEAVAHLAEREQAIATDEKELETRQATLTAGMAELAEKEQSWGERQAELKALQAAVTAHEATLAEGQAALQGDLDQLAEQQADAAHDRVKLDTRTSALEEEAAALKSREAQVSEQQGELTQTKADLDGRQRELDELDAVLKTEREQIEAFEKGVLEKEEAFEQEQSAFRTELDGVAAERERLATLAESMALQEAALAQERDSLDQGAADLEQGHFALSKDQKRLEADRGAAQQLRVELEERDTEIRGRQAELKKEEERVGGLTESIEREQAELREAASSVQQETEEVAEARRRLTDEQAQLKTEREALGQARAELTQAEEALNVARADIVERERQVADLDRRRVDVEAAELAAQTQETTLQNQARALNEQQDALEQRERAAEKREESIQERSRQLEEESAAVDAWRAELDHARKDSLEEAERSIAFGSELEELRQQLLADQKSLEEMRSALQKDRREIEDSKRRLSEQEEHWEEEKRAVGREREDLLRSEQVLAKGMAACDRRAEALTERSRSHEEAQAEILDLRDQVEGLEARLKQTENDPVSPHELALRKAAEAEVARLGELLKAAQSETAGAQAKLAEVREEVGGDKRRIASEQDRLLSEMETLRTQLEAQGREREELDRDRRILEERFSLQRTELDQKIDELEALRLEHEAAEGALDARRNDLAELEEAHQQALSELARERQRFEGDSKGQVRESESERLALVKEKQQQQRMADELADERAELHRMRLSVEVRESKLQRAGGSADPNVKSARQGGRLVTRGLTKLVFSLLVGTGVGAYLYDQEKPSFAVQGQLPVQFEGDLSQGNGGLEKLMQSEAVLGLVQASLGEDLRGLFDPGREDRIQTEVQNEPGQIFFMARRECDDPDLAARQIDALLAATRLHIGRIANEEIDVDDPDQVGILEAVGEVKAQIAAKDKQIQEELIPRFSDPHPRDVQNRLNEHLNEQRQELERLRAEYDRVATRVRDLRRNADAPKGTLTPQEIAGVIASDASIQKDFEMWQSQVGLARNLIAEALDKCQGKFKPIHAALDQFEKTLNERAKNETDLSATGVFESIKQKLTVLRKDADAFERDWNAARASFIQPESDPDKSSLLSRRDDLEKKLKDFQYEANKKLTGFQNDIKGIGAHARGGQTTLQEVSRNAVFGGIFELMQAVEGFVGSASGIFLENNLKLNNTAYKIAGMNRSIAARKATLVQAAQLAANEAAAAKYHETLREAEAMVDELGLKRDKQVDACMITGNDIIELNDAVRIEDGLARDLRQAEGELKELKARQTEMEQHLAALRNTGGAKLLVPGDPAPARKLGPSSGQQPRIKKAAMTGGMFSVGVLAILLLGSFVESWVVGRRGRPGSLPSIDNGAAS